MKKLNGENIEHVTRNCFFCKLIKDKRIRDKEWYRIVEWEKDYFVMLSNKPKISGHLLIVSMHPYDDVTGLKVNSSEAASILNAVVKWAKILKECLHAEKVYALTMCDHWNLDELSENKETTEHLHFHLLPRYETNRPERGEDFLVRKEECGFESRPFVLEEINKYIKKKMEKL